MTSVETISKRSDVEAVPGRRVLFVDDEPHLLAGLRRMLRPYRDRWDVSFASSGHEALDLMATNPVDAIVSDMRMPQMDGGELLAAVRRSHPATARIILSGQADLASVLAVLRSAQQFLAKPCDVGVLTAAVDQTLEVQRLLTDPGLRNLIGGVDVLPVLPAVYHELVAQMDSPLVELASLSAILASDVATSAALLKLVNSAFFGLPREIASVESAVSLLGIDNIQALVLAGSVFRSATSAARAVDVERLRGLALHRVAIGRAIAKLEGWPTHERNLVVLSCMLRDVGELVLADGMPGATARLAQSVTGDADSVSRADLELEAFGCTVPQASAYLLGLWGFASVVVHTIASQSLVEPGPATTHFAHLLRFAHLRALDSVPSVTEAPDGYLTSERLTAWNMAADGVNP